MYEEEGDGGTSRENARGGGVQEWIELMEIRQDSFLHAHADAHVCASVRAFARVCVCIHVCRHRPLFSMQCDVEEEGGFQVFSCFSSRHVRAHTHCIKKESTNSVSPFMCTQTEEKRSWKNLFMGHAHTRLSLIHI